MRASRLTACSSDSRTSRPPPSPQTKPSRSASKGRDAFVGSSLRVDMAFIWQKPAMVSGRMMASAPPAIITSASSRWMIFMASPMAWLPVAQAVTTDELGPLAPNRMEITPEAILMMIIGTKKGETRSIPRSFRMSYCSSRVPMPPMPEPTSTPKRAPSTVSTLRPASSTAMTAQAIAYLRKGSNFRSSFLSMYLSGSKPRTSPAMRVGKPVVSKRVIGPIPDLPAIRAAQNSSAVFPTGVTAPTPVTTTRFISIRRAPRVRPLLILFDVVDGVPDGHNLLGILVGNLEVELFLEGHHQLDGVEGVGAEVLDELRVGVDLVFFDPELLADDFLHPLFDRLRHEGLLTSMN